MNFAVACRRSVQGYSRITRHVYSPASHFLHWQNAGPGGNIVPPALGGVRSIVELAANKVLDKVLDELHDQMKDYQHGGQGWRPATQDQLSAHVVNSNLNHYASRSMLSRMGNVQLMQIAAPYISVACKELKDLVFKDYPDLQMNDLYREHGEMTAAFEKLHSLDPKKKELRQELDTLTHRYIQFGVDAIRVMQDYTDRSRIGRWWYCDDTKQQLNGLMEQYKFFLQSFNVILQVDTRLAMHNEFSVVHRAVNNIDQRIERLFGVLARLEESGRDIRKDIRSAQSTMAHGFAQMGQGQSDAKVHMSHGFDRVAQGQQEAERHINSNMDNKHQYLQAGLDFLVSQNTQILDHQSKTFHIIEKMQNYQEEQGRFIMQQVVEQRDFMKKQAAIIESLSAKR
eukprot:TRINITY_DN55022_c0_g1_i1.p1 TRINITY_DN55022_c0_g1~~TRINITY_DN55022_c0_g1_i1.p1  ORF type:complete len:398 (-),score=57.46 TRINITY_DN55022_c0_g1_i1:156-1349(-)